MARLAIALVAPTVCGAFAYGLWQRHCRRQDRRRADQAREQARELQAEVDKLMAQVETSRSDSLTGLLTCDQWGSEAAALLASGQARAMLWIDLDRFKDVNSMFGHLAGNVVLAEIGQRLRTCTDAGLAGRFGGDEFVVVLPYLPTAVHLEGLAEQLGQEINVTTPLDQTPRTARVTASIGIAVWNSAAPHELPILLDLSDRAMREAKKRGDCGFIVHKEQPGQIPRRVF